MSFALSDQDTGFDKVESCAGEQTIVTDRLMAMVPMARFSRSEKIAFLTLNKVGHMTGANCTVDGEMSG